MLRTSILLGVSLASAAFALAIPDPVNPDPESPRPIEAVDSVFIEELTWMEVRDAMRAGKTTVLVATGGLEQNGPYLAIGKHNYILRATTEAIARRFLPKGPASRMAIGRMASAQSTAQRTRKDPSSANETPKITGGGTLIPSAPPVRVLLSRSTMITTN